MKLNRLVIFLFIPLLFFVFLRGNYSLLLFTEIVICTSIFEFYNMLQKKNKKIYIALASIISFLIPLVIFFKLIDPLEIIIISLLALSIAQILYNSIENSTEKLSLTFFAIIYISVLFSYILKIKQLEYGNLLLTLAFIQIWACDTMAYIFGITFGKHKFSKISPNKSIEGLIGAFVGVLVINVFSRYILSFLVKITFTTTAINITLYKLFSFKTILLSLIITIFCVFGDLFESKLKREFGIKDSSNLLLGHGGFLDRFDSALFVLPLTYYIYSLLV